VATTAEPAHVRVTPVSFVVEGFLDAHRVMAWWTDDGLAGSTPLLERAALLAANGTVVGSDFDLGEITADVTEPLSALLTVMAAMDGLVSLEASTAPQ
jgi:hypothetical protein